MSAIHSASPNISFGPSMSGSLAPRIIGCAVVRGNLHGKHEQHLVAAKKEALREIEANLTTIQEQISHFSAYFKAAGHSCPLDGQLRRIRSSGFPTISLGVDALLIAEMSTGILMGAQDLDKINGSLTYETAKAAESFIGMRGQIRCAEGEIVIRDESAIIASYFQGPDRRTAITPKTNSIVFFAFSAPNVEEVTIRSALEKATSVFVGVAETIVSHIHHAG